MSNGTPPIQPAPVPPSNAGIPQPVFGSGSATAPATPIPNTGTPILPPPLISNPPGVPVFPPTTGAAPVPVPVGPLVGPAVSPAPVPPSLPGVPQPQFAGGGSATVPASLFPNFTTTPSSPPIVVNPTFRIGAVPPPLPTTPGIAPIVISTAPAIPQLPWSPPSASPPPVNTAPPVVTAATNLEVGSVANAAPGTWTNATSTAQQWLRDGSPIFPGSGTSYTFAQADVGLMIGLIETAIGPGGETSAESNEVGPIIEPPLADPEATALPRRPVARSGSQRPKTTRRK
ncbi:MAG TPA: hypothetical protein VGG68_11500 [Caulobacteraceae bacterium]|jgi:hypothetical protein